MVGEDIAVWCSKIDEARNFRIAHRDNYYRKLRRDCRRVYDGPVTQGVIAVIIISSFITVCIEAQEQPQEGTDLARLILNLDAVFTTIFILDLCANFYAHYFKAFAYNPWNIFDCVIVFVSVVSLLNASSANPYEGLEILSNARAFRIFRLAGKFSQLKKIVGAIGTSVIPMANGFLIALIFGSIFCVLGTGFFKDMDPDNFGTFARTFYTLWLAMAFGIWDNQLSFQDENSRINFGVVLYLVVFVIFMLWISLQVVLAILLENFVSAQQEEQAREAKAQLDTISRANKTTGGLDPLLGEMFRCFDTTENMVKGVTRIFLFLDTGENGYLAYSDVYQGCKKLNTQTMVRVSDFDWDILTHDVTLLDEDERMSLPNFHRMMRHQLTAYVQRHVSEVQSLNEDAIDKHWTF
eukprot:CAMPEP_0173466768 /NCGR_PEP_ID=MMETSP1357-20121228/73909_1 /TAXON_ID=77926 /ORGANISM="Hemiselmis rufescens, Strain PCC563" /LENGTH=408 /DNA_ID=CAMNT_0014434851 /DNA_START=1 /DNA_END=1224 /DNA_ORIENTATION=+